jgi:hypothetical protein
MAASKSIAHKKKKHFTLMIGDVILILLNLLVVLPAVAAYVITLTPEMLPSSYMLSNYFARFLTIFYSLVPLICLMNIIVLYIKVQRHSLANMHKIYTFLAIILSFMPIVITLSAYIQRYT